ncbi:DNA polymerase III subunit delta [PVC group bacterium (ex Bugula neritina AB1)]|nr:DNA polymerase III subunit delta [PVC group bacterium (ex Bugula neritina AB1)]
MFHLKIDKTDVEDLDPLYVFVGKDLYLKKKLIEAFRYKWSETEMDNSLGAFHFNGKMHSSSEIINACLSMSLLQSKTLVICEEADVFLKDKAILDYFQNPTQATCLVLFIKDRRSFPSKLKEKCDIQTLKPLDRSNFSLWLRDYCKENGISWDFKIRSFLEQQYTGDLLKIQQDIDKLVTYAGSEGKLTLEELKDLVMSVDNADVFLLLDDMLSKKYDLAIKRLNAILVNGNGGYDIAGVFMWHFKKLWALREAREQGLSSDQILKKLSMKPWVFKKMTRQEKAFNKIQMCDIFEKIYDLELDLKKNNLSPKTIFQKFILSF